MCRNRVMKDMKEYLPLKFHEQQAAMLLCSFEILEKYLHKRRTHNYHHVQIFHSGNRAQKNMSFKHYHPSMNGTQRNV